MCTSCKHGRNPGKNEYLPRCLRRPGVLWRLSLLITQIQSLIGELRSHSHEAQPKKNLKRMSYSKLASLSSLCFPALLSRMGTQEQHWISYGKEKKPACFAHLSGSYSIF